jgi:hypothetical protein
VLKRGRKAPKSKIDRPFFFKHPPTANAVQHVLFLR